MIDLPPTALPPESGTSPSATPSHLLGVIALTIAVVSLALAVAGPALFVQGFFTALSTIGLSSEHVAARTEWADALVFAARGYVIAAVALSAWGLVQGFVAIARRRGRGFGAAAVCVSLLTIVVLLVVWLLVAWATNPAQAGQAYLG